MTARTTVGLIEERVEELDDLDCLEPDPACKDRFI